MALRSLMCLSLVGCFRSVTWFECDDSGTPVSDFKPTPGGTAVDLLAALTGSGTVEGVLLDAQRVGVTWTVERGEGKAEWVESVLTSHEEHAGGLGFGNSVLLADPDCHDRLEVPLVASVVTDDGTVDVAVHAVGESRPDLGGVVPNVEGMGPYEEASFPAVPDVDPADFDDKHAFVLLRSLDATVFGKAGWGGNESETSSSAHYIVEFPPED